MGITDKEIKDKSKKFRKEYSVIDNALCNLFRVMNKNDMDEVMIKVTALNELYSTNINGVKNLEIIAEIIYNTEGLDKMIKDGDMNAVDIIGQTKEGINNAYVFASKYCSFHEPNKYLIFDACSWLALRNICKEYQFETQLTKNPTMNFEAYKLYCEAVHELIKKFSITCSYKEIDEYLWMTGDEFKKN